MMTPLERAIDICDNQTRLSEKSGVKQVTISACLNRFNHKVGAENVIPLSRATDWKVTPHDFRPDLYPHPSDGLPADLWILFAVVNHANDLQPSPGPN